MMIRNCNIHQDFLESFLSLLKNQPEFYITAHANADPDALAAMVGTCAFIRAIYPDKIIHIVSPQMNRLAQKVYSELVEPLDQWKIEKKFDTPLGLIIIVDTCDIGMTDIFSKHSILQPNDEFLRIIVIDHHSASEYISPLIPLAHIISQAASSAEII